MIWIVTNEGVGDSIYESQVLGQLFIINNLGHDCKIITYHTWWNNFTNSRINRKRFVLKYGMNNIKLFWAPFFYLPFSIFYSVLHFSVFYMISKNKPKIIHCRTEYSVLITMIIKMLFNIRIIYDCRGDSLAEFYESFQPKNFQKKIFKLYTSIVIKLRINLALYYSDIRLFVSEELKTRYKIKHCNNFVVPCLPIDGIFFFDQNIRKKSRKKFQLTNNKVILYSGAMTGYQNFEFAVKSISHLLNDEVLLWVVTKDVQKAKVILMKLLNQNQYKIDSLSFSKMNEAYNASDYGLLIRDKNITNLVASPTKFYEYCFTGLQVIHNDSIRQVDNVTNYLGNRIDLDSKLPNFMSDIERSKISNNAIVSFKKSNFIEVYKYIYG